MPDQTNLISPVNALLAEFGTRLNEVEEKHRLIRDRSLLIGENLISIKEDLEKQNFEIKKQINELNKEVKELKKFVNRIINEMPNLARKSELEILENQSKIFQPLEFARIKDVEQLINKKLKDLKSKEANV
ncbi:MAG: hypothetical protein AABW90_03220 [Nanoarchaeota archaeon]